MRTLSDKFPSGGGFNPVPPRPGPGAPGGKSLDTTPEKEKLLYIFEQRFGPCKCWSSALSTEIGEIVDEIEADGIVNDAGELVEV